MSDLLAKSQSTRRSGVGGHHQNAVAENGIKIVTRKAGTLMIHSSLHWT